MDTDTEEPQACTKWPLSPATLANLRRIRDHIVHMDEATGGWTWKGEARHTGFSIHFKYAQKVEDFQDSLRQLNLVSEGPALILDALERLELAHEAQTAAWVTFDPARPTVGHLPPVHDGLGLEHGKVGSDPVWVFDVRHRVVILARWTQRPGDAYTGWWTDLMGQDVHVGWWSPLGTPEPPG